MRKLKFAPSISYGKLHWLPIMNQIPCMNLDLPIFVIMWRHSYHFCITYPAALLAESEQDLQSHFLLEFCFFGFCLKNKQKGIIFAQYGYSYKGRTQFYWLKSMASRYHHYWPIRLFIFTYYKSKGMSNTYVLFSLLITVEVL